MPFIPFGPNVPQLIATTGPNGFVLQNATPTIMTWNVPNDGNLHRILMYGDEHVTVAETGGAVSVTFTLPDGFVVSPTVFPGGSGTGGVQIGVPVYTVKAGTTVTIAQSSPLTVGACTLWLELWGS